MPQSRSRRKKTTRQPKHRTTRGRQPGDLASRLRLLHATDAAEARGDAFGAWELVRGHLEEHPELSFWRPSRIERCVATPGLLAAADHVHDWTRAPMGGFCLVDVSPWTLTWVDLAAGTEVGSLNLGAAVALDGTQTVIGRLVPVASGSMFETAGGCSRTTPSRPRGTSSRC